MWLLPWYVKHRQLGTWERVKLLVWQVLIVEINLPALSDWQSTYHRGLSSLEMATREPLGDFLTALVAILAILIILVNGLLCVFLVRDSRLWKLVRPDYMIESIIFLSSVSTDSSSLWPWLIFWSGSFSSHKWFTKTGSKRPAWLNLTKQHAGIWIPNIP